MMTAIRLGTVASCLLAVSAAAAPPAPPPESGSLHAVLINGGDRPESNYLSHLHHLQDMVALLRARGVPDARIHVFSADGEEPAPDLATRDVPPTDFWILDGTALGARLRPQTRVIDTEWAGVRLRPARRGALQEWFGLARLSAGDRLLVFVTDHGTGEADPENAAISLWREQLTVRELRTMLRSLPSGVQVAMVMSQCYSGAFARAMSDGGAEAPAADVCGFFSTTADQKAYGCYPEGRDRDQIGHAFEFIDALGRRATTAEAHLEVLSEDDTPDVPLRTTDDYLAREVQAEAAARGVPPDTLVDALLAEAWRDRRAWEAELRLLDRIGSAFGTFSPRSLLEIAAREKELEALTKQMSTYAENWQSAFGALQEAQVREFVQARPEWKPRLETAALQALPPGDRLRLLEELLPALLAHARAQQSWAKVETFRGNATRASAARWRLEVRQAAVKRMRTVLVSVAGRILAARKPATSGVLARLTACESLAVGTPPAEEPARASAAAPFPPLSAEVALLEVVSPSWLGVRFRAVNPQIRAARALPAGANFLDAVYPGSPAEEAGLRPGDIVVGLPGQAFDSTRDLREWTMTSPRGVPRVLSVLRPGGPGQPDERLEARLVLRAFPVDLPRLPDPPQAGERAPALPAGVHAVRGPALAEMAGRPHVLFFWATWCGPCKRAVPEVRAFAVSRGLPVVAISDEDEETVRRFLTEYPEPFFEQVAVDPMRDSFRTFGVSGTPTLLVMDAGGTIRHRQVGYSPDKGVTIEGWQWARP
jgi:thiol-disulfide isomerase/thioredoxin